MAITGSVGALGVGAIHVVGAGAHLVGGTQTLALIGKVGHHTVHYVGKTAAVHVGKVALKYTGQVSKELAKQTGHKIHESVTKEIHERITGMAVHLLVGVGIGLASYVFEKGIEAIKEEWEAQEEEESLLTGVDVLGYSPPLKISTWSAQDQLYHAAYFGLSEKIKRLIHDEDVNPNGFCEGSVTGLTIAVWQGNLLSVKALEKADPNRHVAGNMGPVHAAVITQRLPMLRILMAMQADFNAPGPENRLPLELAMLERFNDVFDWLLNEAKARPSLWFGGEPGEQLVHVTARCGSSQALLLLLDKYPELRDLPDGYGNFPLHHAAGAGHLCNVALLLERGAPIEATNKGGQTPLMRAAFKGKFSSVVLLLEQGAHLNCMDNEGSTALHLALQNRHSLVANFLIASGSPLSETNKAGQTALGLAVEGNDELAVKELLARGVSTSQPHVWSGRTLVPLHLAVLLRQEKIALSLADLQSVVVQDDRGAFALHYACEAGMFGLVDLLLQLTPEKVNAKDRGGRTAAILAAGQSSIHLVKALKRAGADFDPFDAEENHPLLVAARAGHKQIVDLILEWGVPKHLEFRGRTLLHEAARNGWDNIVQSAIDMGLPVNLADEAGSTPLHEVARSNSVTTGVLLVKAGADVNAQTRVEGWTPLHTAAAAGTSAMIGWLVEQGANLSMKDRNGLTPFVVAVSFGQLEAAQRLYQLYPAALSSSEGQLCLSRACFYGYCDLISWLLAKGISQKQLRKSAFSALREENFLSTEQIDLVRSNLITSAARHLGRALVVCETQLRRDWFGNQISNDPICDVLAPYAVIFDQASQPGSSATVESLLSSGNDAIKALHEKQLPGGKILKKSMKEIVTAYLFVNDIQHLGEPLRKAV